MAVQRVFAFQNLKDFGNVKEEFHLFPDFYRLIFDDGCVRYGIKFLWFLIAMDLRDIESEEKIRSLTNEDRANDMIMKIRELSMYTNKKYEGLGNILILCNVGTKGHSFSTNMPYKMASALLKEYSFMVCEPDKMARI